MVSFCTRGPKAVTAAELMCGRRTGLEPFLFNLLLSLVSKDPLYSEVCLDLAPTL